MRLHEKEKLMTEEELRAFDPTELEKLDIAWDNGTPEDPYKFIGKVLFDYDQGLSVLKKDDPTHCLTGIHGPSYKKNNSNYETKERYHEDLSSLLSTLQEGYCKGPTALSQQMTHTGSVTVCSFT